MNIADRKTYRQRQADRNACGEMLLVGLVFASMGAITWAIRGTNGWSGIDGTILPGMTWGMLWWYVCWRNGVDARGVSLWLGLGIALGGELGYGQYVSWIRGMFHVGDEVVPIAPPIGYVWLALCGIAWGAPGAIALGWALSPRRSLGVWLARLLVPLGIALATRCLVQAWPWVFFPNWDLSVYVAGVQDTTGGIAAATWQRDMTFVWLVSALLGIAAWLTAMRSSRPSRIGCVVAACLVGAAALLLLPFAQWLFFPEDQLNLFAGELGGHLGRTVYTNSQNAIVVGWWVGALLVALGQRDRPTVFASLVIGLGFGAGFPAAATWCLGYAYAPTWIDWWKMWELNAGFYLGLLYVVVLDWAIRHVDSLDDASRENDLVRFQLWCETVAMSLGVFLVIFAMAREEFFVVGTLLGLYFVVAMFWATWWEARVVERRQSVCWVYSLFLLVFLLAWGGTATAGILLGMYDADAVDQYAWPAARIALFFPAGLLIVGVALWKTVRVERDPDLAFPPRHDVPRVNARMIDLMTFTGVVGAVSIWPSKIGVLYALFLGLALFGFNRLVRRFDKVEG